MAPRLDAGLGPAAALFAQAARRAARLYDAIPGAVVGRTALQLAAGPKDPSRFAAIAGADLFEPGAMRRLDSSESTARLGEPAPEGLLIDDARIVRPGAILDAWLAGRTVRARITALDCRNGVWRLIGEDGALAAEAEAVCLAAGLGSAALAPGLDLAPVRGQASLFHGAPWSQACLFGAYAIPTPEGVLIGATHDRGDTGVDPRPEDRRRNLAGLAATLPGFAERLADAPAHDWCGVRATTTDYLPLAGAVPGAAPGLMALSGLGSRGFCLAPLLAEHLAAGLSGAPSPLPQGLSGLVDPGRFAARAARRGRPAT
jgi:tRNA 5-methylaminomethyl-2-thiouridine biosynthesis bifunctional protein